MGLLKCPKCGFNKVEAGTPECPNCGVIFKKYQDEVRRKNKERKANLKQCDACSGLISKKAVTCPRCGEPQSVYNQILSSQEKEKNSFFGSIFDLSFSGFITTEIIKILYVISILFSGVTALGIVISGFTQSVGYGIGMLILSPIVFFLQIIVARMWFELIIVIFKIAENTSNNAHDKG